MLKLNYNDYGLFLERVTASLDMVATQRVMLAMYTGETLHMQPGRAAYLAAADAPEVLRLERLLQGNTALSIALTHVDDECVEVSLKGTWIAQSADAEAGTLIAALPPVAEGLIHQLWQLSARQAAFSY